MSLSIGPLGRENITAVIYRKMKQRLMMGALAPGEALTLRSITDELGVSQTPVREALLQLASEGSLTVTPGRSVRVPELSHEAVIELRRIRLVLERMATAEAALHMTKERIRRMVEIHARMAEAKQREDREGTLQGNFDLHFAVYEAAGMPRLLGMIENLWAQTGPSLRLLYTRPFFHLEGAHPHLALIKALRKKDPDAAAAAIEHDIVGHGAALHERLPR